MALANSQSNQDLISNSVIHRHLHELNKLGMEKNLKKKMSHELAKQLVRSKTLLGEKSRTISNAESLTLHLHKGARRAA